MGWDLSVHEVERAAGYKKLSAEFEPEQARKPLGSVVVRAWQAGGRKSSE